MAERVQVILKAEEKIRLQLQAEREGTSLSAWLRQVALERLAASTDRRSFESRAQLREFFQHCATLEPGDEPDWELQRDVIHHSRTSGSSRT